MNLGDNQTETQVVGTLILPSLRRSAHHSKTWHLPSGLTSRPEMWSSKGEARTEPENERTNKKPGLQGRQCSSAVVELLELALGSVALQRDQEHALQSFVPRQPMGSSAGGALTPGARQQNTAVPGHRLLETVRQPITRILRTTVAL